MPICILHLPLEYGTLDDQIKPSYMYGLEVIKSGRRI